MAIETQQNIRMKNTDIKSAKIRFLIIATRQYSTHIGKTISQTVKLLNVYGVDKFLYDNNETIGGLTTEHRNIEIDNFIKNRCQENL